MSKKKLFEDNSDEDITLKTENEYAKKYDTWREKEEIHKLEQKYGPKALNSDASGSSESEDESDETPEVSEEMEEQFLKTLALLKTKDPRIYDPNFKLFDEQKKEAEEKKSKTKTLTFEDSDDNDDQDEEIFKIEKKAEIDDIETEKVRQAGKQTQNSNKEKNIRAYLTGKVDHVDRELDNDLAPLKALWSDPKLNEGEAFLRDYILNKRYLEEGDVGDAAEQVRDDADLEADERTVEEQAKFERAYNFRFEEPDEEYLKRFPRTMNYIRPKDDRRARKRAEVRARKEEEKKKKMEEIARLKALKLKEIQEKIARIKEVTGNQDLAFKDADIEGDFDPDEHDRRMRALFDDQYYGDVDQHKPVFPDLDDELEIENWDKYDVDSKDVRERNDDGPHCEDDDFNMDADFDPKQPRATLMEEIRKTLGGKKRRNRKRKSKLAELLTSEKPKFVPSEADKTYAQYMEEYYRMDCEDVIGGDLPTRFKYREVAPNDYGLTVEEILLADDKELTQWVPLKKIMKHRAEAAERGERASYQQRAADHSLKRRLLPSLFRDLPPEPEVVVPVEEGTKKKKKKNKKKKETEDVEVTENGDEQNNEDNQDQNADETTEGQSEVVTKKHKKKRKQKPEENISIEEAPKEERIIENNDQDGSVLNKRKNKKNKHKSDGFIVTDISNVGPSQEVSNLDDSKNNETDTINGVPEIKIGSKRKLKTEIKRDEVPRKKKKNKMPQQLSSNKDQNDKKKFSKKHKQKNQFKNKQSNDKTNDNPLSQLSDERLKAYGLNPKKYRGFLKYKKF